MPAWLLKCASVMVTMLTAAASAGYISGHVKNLEAPLQPPVRTPVRTGTLHLSPSVQGGNGYQPVTSTYAS